MNKLFVVIIFFMEKQSLLNKLVLVGFYAFFSIMILSCASEGGSIINMDKHNDWEKLKLQEKVKEYKEAQNVVRANTYYKIFNVKGYIIEEGMYSGIFPDQKEIRGIREYDDNDNLIKKITYKSPEFYDIEIYDENGKLTEAQHYEKITNTGRNNGPEVMMTHSQQYRYEPDGVNKEKIYRNNKIFKYVEYDKYSNIISEIGYENDKESWLKKNEYTYDNKGNILTRIAYDAQNLLLVKEDKKANLKRHKFIYKYDNDNNLVYTKQSVIQNVSTKKDVVDMKEITLMENSYEYDSMGNQLGRSTKYEFDDKGNWIMKWEGTTSMKRQYYYFGEEDNNSSMDKKLDDFGGNEMTISISDKEPCDGGDFTLTIKNGKAFDDNEKPFKIEVQKENPDKYGDIYPGKFKTNPDGSVSIIIGVSGDETKQKLIVYDANNTQCTESFIVYNCP